jgi:hypothetical protein
MSYFGGAPGVSYSADWWAKVYALFETSFPGLPAGVERAAAVGVPWPSVTTPFVWFDGEEAVSHVGVLMQPMRSTVKITSSQGYTRSAPGPPTGGGASPGACSPRPAPSPTPTRR